MAFRIWAELLINGEYWTMETKQPVEHPLAPLPSAVIIGASSGIGAALAHKLADEGYKLALLARRKDLLDALCEEINQKAGEKRATAYQHDVTDFDQVPALFQNILQDLQDIDIFAYVSGNMYTIKESEYDFAKDLHTMQVNILGAMAWLDQAAPAFEKMGKGHLVGVSSVAGDRGRVGNPPYHTAKGAFSIYLESLRNRLTRHGVHVLTVKPGYVKTALLELAVAKLPPITPEKAAQDIWKAIGRKRQVLYTPWWWQYIMLIVQHVPSFIFRRINF
jgi:short-subunit dehydrogenase